MSEKAGPELDAKLAEALGWQWWRSRAAIHEGSVLIVARYGETLAHALTLALVAALEPVESMKGGAR